MLFKFSMKEFTWLQLLWKASFELKNKISLHFLYKLLFFHKSIFILS